MPSFASRVAGVLNLRRHRRSGVPQFGRPGPVGAWRGITGVPAALKLWVCVDVGSASQFDKLRPE